MKFVLNQATEYKLLTERESNLTKHISIQVYWIKSQKGWYKLNIDGAFKNGDSHSGIGGIIRNSSGDWVMGVQMKSHSKSSIHSELQALYIGLQLTWEQKLYPLEVETDATHVINYINHGCVTYDSLVNNCRWLISKMDMQVIRHSFR